MKKRYFAPTVETSTVDATLPIASSYEDIHAGGTGIPSVKEQFFDVASDDDNAVYVSIGFDKYELKQ